MSLPLTVNEDESNVKYITLNNVKEKISKLLQDVIGGSGKEALFKVSLDFTLLLPKFILSLQSLDWQVKGQIHQDSYYIQDSSKEQSHLYLVVGLVTFPVLHNSTSWGTIMWRTVISRMLFLPSILLLL